MRGSDKAQRTLCAGTWMDPDEWSLPTETIHTMKEQQLIDLETRESTAAIDKLSADTQRDDPDPLGPARPTFHRPDICRRTDHPARSDLLHAIEELALRQRQRPDSWGQCHS